MTQRIGGGKEVTVRGCSIEAGGGGGYQTVKAALGQGVGAGH